jgi:hypothetical protein
MLNAHPRIYLTYEAGFWVGSAWTRWLGARSWLARYFDSPQFQVLGLERSELLAELEHDSGELRFSDVMSAVMRCKARASNKPRCGDKTPLHLARLARLFRDFPDARVIHIVRDPRDTVASLARMPWAPASLLMNAVAWRMLVHRAASWGERLLEVRLEDLQDDSEAVMRRVLEFVGEPWHPAVLDHASPRHPSDLPSLPWLAGATAPLAPRRSGPPSLPRAWVRIVEAISGAARERYGYVREPLAEEPSAWEVLTALASDLPRALGAMARTLRLLAAELRPRASRAEALHRLTLSLNPRAWEHYPSRSALTLAVFSRGRGDPHT